MLISVTCVAGCLRPVAVADGALVRDVIRRPPDAKEATITALVADPTFGKWVIEIDRQCDLHGCIE